jgi:putative N6-adenine-specific DNA methylase
MRIDEFKCRDAPKLFNKISKIPWAKYLLNEKVNVEASSSESRLFDSRKIESATVDGIKNFIHSNPLKKKYLTHPQANQYQASVYIRIVHDICTVSLDTSGEILHKRGEKELSGFAPIRENIAFSLLFSMLKDVSESDLNLIDPMCGSGTFLIEAARLNHTVHQRDFSYHLFPIYIEEKDKQLLIPNHEISKFNLYGFDIEPSIIEQTSNNLAKYKPILKVQNLFLNNEIFNTQFKNFVILNPPYGIRVKTNEVINSNYYVKIIEKILQIYTPVKIGIIIPTEYPFKGHKNFNLKQTLKFKNGGIPVTFYQLESK